MKTMKKLMAIAILVVLCLPVFAKNINAKQKTNPFTQRGDIFSMLPYRSLSNPTSYTVNFAVQDVAITGYVTCSCAYNGQAIHDYIAYIYVTETGVTDFSQRITVPTGSSITGYGKMDVNYLAGGYYTMNVEMTIASGNSYASLAYSQVGSPILVYDRSLSVSSFLGLPLDVSLSTLYW